MTKRAFRSTRGLVEGLALITAACLGTVGLAACGAPAYHYVADSHDKAYYKVPTDWHAISQTSMDAELQQAGGSGAGAWITAFDGTPAPTAGHFLAFTVAKPFVFSEVGTLTPDAMNSLSYNGLRDFLFPVSSTSRQQVAASGTFPLSAFKQIRDVTITGTNGVHGVRETFDYTYQGVADTFDETVLTNANQTVVYFLIVHCTDACYSQNQTSINTVMSSFTVGSS